MAWYSDWEVRFERLRANGLLVLVNSVRIEPDTGFAAVHFTANEGDLPRSHIDRGFGLHLTLGYESDYGDGVAASCVAALNERYAGRLIRLRISHVGGGGSVQLAADDVLASDPDIYWLHSRGWYGNGQHVRARDLHVSL